MKLPCETGSWTRSCLCWAGIFLVLFVGSGSTFDSHYRAFNNTTDAFLKEYMRDWAAGRYEIPDLKKMRKSQGWACAICSYVPPVRLFEFLPEDHGDFYELKPYTYNASVERERAAEVKSLSAARNDVLVAYSLEPGNIGDWTDWIDSLSVVRYETETEHILRPGDPRKRSDLVGDSLGPVVFLKDIDDNLKLNPADTNEGRP